MNISPELVVHAYQQGIFPMADSRDGEVAWYRPEIRAILPIDGAKFSRSLLKRIRRGDYLVTRDQAFAEVIERCALPRAYADETWINDEIIETFCELHDCGIAHSVEAWTTSHAGGHADESDEAPQDRKLVGGLYGVALGGAFFGESMFSIATDASKVCLHHLVQHVRDRGFTLIDTQFGNPHMEQFGIVELPHEAYLELLRDALRIEATW